MVACGLFLGTGLLAHYDALLVVPAVVYAAGSALVKAERPAVPCRVTAVLAGGVVLLVVAGLFYVPYLLDPQAARTGGYLGDRIGGQLIKNNLDSFQQAQHLLHVVLLLRADRHAGARISGVGRMPCPGCRSAARRIALAARATGAGGTRCGDLAARAAHAGG